MQSDQILRYGAYICLRVPDQRRQKIASAPVPALAERLRLTNEFAATEGRPSDAIAFLRRVDATPAQIADDELLRADALVHVASATAATVAQFCSGLADLLGPAVARYVLRGVVRPTNFTGNAMHEFAYANQLVQQPGVAAPNAFFIPMSKTPEWWAKGWMERHTYFLPRYDDSGRMVNEGHVLAAAAGVSTMMRRTYKSEMHPAPAGDYDFLNYFECADAAVPTFHAVCAALRDVKRNPEWKFVREGPTWHGRRVSTWPELFT